MAEQKGAGNGKIVHPLESVFEGWLLTAEQWHCWNSDTCYDSQFKEHNVKFSDTWGVCRPGW